MALNTAEEEFELKEDFEDEDFNPDLRTCLLMQLLHQILINKLKNYLQEM